MTAEDEVRRLLRETGDVAAARQVLAELDVATMALFEKYHIRRPAEPAPLEVGELLACAGPADHAECARLATQELQALYRAGRDLDAVGQAAIAVARRLRELEPPPRMPARAPAAEVTPTLEPWDGPPIPENATAAGTFYLPNGVYATYGAGGELRFAVRIVEGSAQAWLNLRANSGHFDEGNEGQAWHANGTMENFSNWDDDSPPFPATEPFKSWRRKRLNYLLRPLPAGPGASCDPAFQLRMRLLFPGLPEEWTAPADFPNRFLELVRRLPLLRPAAYASRSSLRQALREVAGLAPDWADCLVDAFAGTGPLACALAGLGPKFAEAATLRRLAELTEKSPGTGAPST